MWAQSRIPIDVMRLGSAVRPSGRGPRAGPDASAGARSIGRRPCEASEHEGPTRVYGERAKRRPAIELLCRFPTFIVSNLKVSFGRKARLQESPREGPDCAPKPP